MFKKVLTVFGLFALIFTPVVALSFCAYTVFHQGIMLVSAFIAALTTYYFTKVLGDRARLQNEAFAHLYELRKAKEALSSCLATETQTQAYNERLLNTRLFQECERAKRYDRALSVLLVGIDSQPEISKYFGAHLPERMTQTVQDFLRQNTRSVDVIIRRGEDQFVIILPETQLDPARIAAERVRYGVDKKVFHVEDRELDLTVSIGIVTFDSSIHSNKDELISALDGTLKEAIKTGPNQIAALTSVRK
jgi:diguanylate cyclase (GGDEF)-like protein